MSYLPVSIKMLIGILAPIRLIGLSYAYGSSTTDKGALNGLIAIDGQLVDAHQ